MSVHLNECQCYEGSCCSWMVNCTCQCICDVLRACEERIKTHEGCADAERIEGYVDGYADALDAAREAVASMEIAVVGNSAATVDQALAVIESLRKEQQ